MPSLDSIASLRSKVDPTRTVLVMGAGAALGDFNGTVKIDRHANTTDTSLLKMTDYFRGIYKNPVEPTQEEVMVRKLDDHHLEIKPELTNKIDVEGYEENVIRGGKKTLDKAKIVYILKKKGLGCSGFSRVYFHCYPGAPHNADAIFIRE
jgi:FkbM family methyltransferase